MPTPLQIKTARGALGWNRRRMAERFRISEWTVYALEQPEDVDTHQTARGDLAEDLDRWISDTAAEVVRILKAKGE